MCARACACVYVLSRMAILTVFKIREGETSECYCKRSTSCLISKNLSLFLWHSDMQKSWQADFAFYLFLFYSIFFAFIFHYSLFPSLSIISTGLVQRAAWMQEERQQLKKRESKRTHAQNCKWERLNWFLKAKILENKENKKRKKLMQRLHLKTYF